MCDILAAVGSSIFHSMFHTVFFLMIPPPPRSTLFPYTTLFRSVDEPRERIEPHHARPIGHEVRERVDVVEVDRKSTRLNSSHSQISYAVFCLKKKRKMHNN